MLNQLIRVSLAQRDLVLMAAIALLFFGAKKAMESPIDVLPDLTKPTVTLLTEAPGLAPEEVETLITIPLENALMGVTGVDRVRAVNDVGLSLIFVEFDWDMDIYDGRDFVQERLFGLGDQLPEGVTPYMTPVTSLMGDIMLVGIRDTSGNMAPRDLRELADWVVARRLQSIPGVAESLAIGGGVKQIQIQPDPERMARHQVTLDQLRTAAAGAVENSTGGFLTERPTEVMVRNLAMTTDLDEIATTVVSYRNDRPVLIEDVAQVVWDIEPMRGDAAMGVAVDNATSDQQLAHRGVSLSVRKAPGFDTIALTQEVERALEELRASVPEGVELIPLYRQADYIHLAVGNLEEALRDGALMVAAILAIFLLNARVTLITLTAIPLSLGITILVFDFMNLTLNSMTLGGLAVAVGMVVDDAIVDVENVYRRLRENKSATTLPQRIEVIARASAEVRSSIFYATVIIVLVFVPLMALSGVEGRLFTPIAIATIVSMAASFLVSLTVIPALCSYTLKPKPGKTDRESAVARALKSIYRKTCLRISIKTPELIYAITAALLLFAWTQYTNMGREFLPGFREPTALVATTANPGTSLRATSEIGDTALEAILRIPGVKVASYRAGRAERGDHVVPVSTVEFDIEFDDDADRERSEIVEEIRETMQGIPGTFSAMSGPLSDRVGHMLSGVSAKVAVKIYGSDLEVLRSLGQEIAEIARDIPGLEETRLEQQASVPQLRIEPIRDRAAAYGVTPGELNRDLASLMDGEKVNEVYEGIRDYDLTIRLNSDWRENPERLRNMYIDTPGAEFVPLDAVAEIRQASGPNTILRENTRRRFVVSVNPTVDNLVETVDLLRQRVESEVELPSGYTLSYEGEYLAQKDAARTIATMSALTLLIVITLLYNYFKSLRFVLVVLTIIPVSLIGAVILTRYTLNNISIATLVGFIAVAGIAARNNIMLISHYLSLMKNENEAFGPNLVIRGAEERLTPILMTALSAGIALAPLVFAAQDSGKEVLNPVAIVIVGGLISSTVLGLCVTPAFFYQFCRGAAHSAIEKGAAAAQ